MPQAGFRLRAAEEGNLARNNGESRPRFPRWPWSPRLRNPNRCRGRRGDGSARRCSAGPDMPAAARPCRCRVTFCSTSLSPGDGPGSTFAPPPRQWVPTGLPAELARACTDPALGPAPSRAIYSHDLSGSRGRRLAAHPPFLAGLPPQPPPSKELPPSRGFYPIRSLIRRDSVSGAAHGRLAKPGGGGGLSQAMENASRQGQTAVRGVTALGHRG